jgi:bifunctional DNA-binding transcriptional regulator/antitoxin component of YhaV-PrlF toxin-antitoxin module
MGEETAGHRVSEGERVRMSDGGRIVIPQHMRQALGVEPGQELLLRMDQDCLRVYSLRSAVKHSQAVVRRYVSEERSLSGELILDRRREAEVE